MVTLDAPPPRLVRPRLSEDAEVVQFRITHRPLSLLQHAQDFLQRGGALGNLFFFGGANGGGGTGDLDGPLYDEEPRYLSALSKITEGLL